jgi:MoxR-like ATPase
MTNALQDLESTLQQRIGDVVLGLSPAIRALCIAVVARGHVLVQGVPGLGKTLLSKSLAGALGGSFKRVQGTSDLMPTDITGTHLFDGSKNAFVFRPGPLFADVVLFDEINRAGPRTQSALLEAMEERQISIDREMFALPRNFLVIATQNPREFEGTYPLPESQLALGSFLSRTRGRDPGAAALHRRGRRAGAEHCQPGTTGPGRGGPCSRRTGAHLP